MSVFESKFSKIGEIQFPEFSNTRILMMPIVLNDMKSIPDSLDHYKPVIEQLFNMQPYTNEIGYLTIDEKIVFEGKSHRRKGIHVDGFEPADGTMRASGAWSGGSWGGGYSPDKPETPWQKKEQDKKEERRNPQTPGASLSDAFNSTRGTGMLLASSHSGCRAWNQEFDGIPGLQGECDHMMDQCREEASEILEANGVYWLDPYCVHESMQQSKNLPRQLLRLSLPSECAWFESCTPNPLGVMPRGEIWPARTAFMQDPNYQ